MNKSILFQIKLMLTYSLFVFFAAAPGAGFCLYNSFKRDGRGPSHGFGRPPGLM